MTLSVASNNPNFRYGPNLRAYVFVHSILAPVQKGIQGAHALQELAVKYRDYKGEKKIADMYWDWAKRCKTVVFCEAGFSSGLEDWANTIYGHPHPYPRASFKEDGETLKGLRTAVTIIIPEHVYKAADAVRKKELPVELDMYTNSDRLLIERLSKAQLAR